MIGLRRWIFAVLALVGGVGLIGLRVYLSDAHEPVTIVEAGLLSGVWTAYFAADAVVKSNRAKAGLTEDGTQKAGEKS